MKIVVLVKQVPTDLAAVSVTPDHTLDRSAAGAEIDPVDKNAVEAAVGLLEQHGGEVVALSMGPAAVRSVLKDCVAVGATSGVAVTDDAFAGSDALATATVLAAAVRAIGDVDLVVAGKQSFDAGTGEVPPMVAELLDVPQVTRARDLQVVDGALLATQLRDGAQAKVRATLPAVVTVDEYANTPRYPSVKSKLAAGKASFQVLDNAALGLTGVGLAASTTTILSAGKPPARQPGVRLTGTADEVADQLVAALADAHIL